MAKTFLTPVDFKKNELLNPRAQNLSTAPGTPVTGQFYYDTDDNTLYWWDGSGWVAAKGSAPSFATPAIVLGTAAAAGVAASTIRSDATIVAFDATAPTTATMGDAAATGSSAVAARRDHVHGMPAFGAVTAQTTFGLSSANGAAATLARSDHTHGTPTHDAAAHSAIPLNALATATADYSMGGFKLTNVGTPTVGTDAINKAYADGLRLGLDFKESVRVATTANGALATAFENTDTIDGVALVTGDRILLKNQTTPAENGIYTVNASGAPTRATDADTNADLSIGSLLFVEAGTANAGQQWVVTAVAATPWVPGTDGTTWTQFSGASVTTAGNGLTASGNTFNVGAGTGIVVTADAVEIDTALVARIGGADIGNGAATSFVVTHNFGKKDVTVAVFDLTTPFAEVECEVEHTSTNTVTVITAPTVPTTNQYRVVVHG